MASRNRREDCVAECAKLGYVICGGCRQWFCKEHFSAHRNGLDNQINTTIERQEQLENDLTKNDASLLVILSKIDSWEMDATAQIHQIAEKTRLEVKNHFDETKMTIKSNLNELSKHLKTNQMSADFTEIELRKWSNQLNRLRRELERLSTIKILNDNRRLSNAIPLTNLEFFQHNKSITEINARARWEEKAVTIAGNGTQGGKTDQLHRPTDVIVDEEGTVFICDSGNHRIMKWKSNAKDGEIVAGGKGPGNGEGQLNGPFALLVDHCNNRLIISEIGNKRITGWPLEDEDNVEIIIDDIRSYGLAIDVQGCLYASVFEKGEVRRYSQGDRVGVIVAGGNGRGNNLNQLNRPRQIFVDDEQSVYISDTNNHRVIKWTKNAKYGLVVAGGQGQGSGLEQLNTPGGIFVDAIDSVYVVDQKNNRVVRWLKSATQGQVIVDYRDKSQTVSNASPFSFGQTFAPAPPPTASFSFGSSSFGSLNQESTGLFIDQKGNLYVADCGHHRIQRFNIQ